MAKDIKKKLRQKQQTVYVKYPKLEEKFIRNHR